MWITTHRCIKYECKRYVCKVVFAIFQDCILGYRHNFFDRNDSSMIPLCICLKNEKGPLQSNLDCEGSLIPCGRIIIPLIGKEQHYSSPQPMQIYQGIPQSLVEVPTYTVGQGNCRVRWSLSRCLVMAKEDPWQAHYAVLEAKQSTTKIFLESLELFYPPQKSLPYTFCKTTLASGTCDQIWFTNYCGFHDISYACTMPLALNPSQMNEDCSCGPISLPRGLKNCCFGHNTVLLHTSVGQPASNRLLFWITKSYVARWSAMNAFSEIYTQAYMETDALCLLSFTHVCLSGFYGYKKSSVSSPKLIQWRVSHLFTKRRCKVTVQSKVKWGEKATIWSRS